VGDAPQNMSILHVLYLLNQPALFALSRIKIDVVLCQKRWAWLHNDPLAEIFKIM
jgi:hypothetical protein